MVFSGIEYRLIGSVYMVNISSIVNQQKQALIHKNYADIYAHELAHKNAGGSLTGPIVIEKNADGIPIGGHVSIKMPALNPKNPQHTIDNANTVINSAMAPSDPSKQEYRVAAQAKTVKRQAINLQNKQKRIDYYA